MSAGKTPPPRWKRDHLSGVNAQRWQKTFDHIIALAHAAGITGEQAQLEAYALANADLHYAEITEPETQEALSYWMFDAIVDSMTRPNHRALEGAIAPAGHPVWEKARPPLGWGCRCTLIALNKIRAKRIIESGKGFDLTKHFPEGAGLDLGFVRPI